MQIKNKFLKIFVLINSTMMFVSFLWLVGGIAVSGLEFHNNHYNHRRTARLLGITVVMFVIVNLTCCFGIKMARRQSPLSKCRVFTYGTILLIFVMIPNMSIGVGLRIFSKMAHTEDQKWCDALSRKQYLASSFYRLPLRKRISMITTFSL